MPGEQWTGSAMGVISKMGWTWSQLAVVGVVARLRVAQRGFARGGARAKGTGEARYRGWLLLIPFFDTYSDR